MPEQPRTPLALAALATIARPGLDVVGTRPPRDPGADFDVVGLLDADGNRWMIRAPRHDAAGAALEGEVALLAELAAAVDNGLLPFDVPRPVGFASLPEGGRAMLYPELNGRVIDPARLGPTSALLASIARAIAALHELSGDVVRAADLPEYDADGYRLRRLAEVDEAAQTGHIPARLLRRWEHALEDVSLWRFRATPVHGDLAAEHVLCRESAVVGIVDWSDARVADPADDLAWLLAATSAESADALMSAYADARGGNIDDAFEARATLAGELAVARWLMHGVRVRSDEVIDDAVAMLAEVDDAVADAPPIGRREPVVEVSQWAGVGDAGVDDEFGDDEFDDDEFDDDEFGDDEFGDGGFGDATAPVPMPVRLGDETGPVPVFVGGPAGDDASDGDEAEAAAAGPPDLDFDATDAFGIDLGRIRPTRLTDGEEPEPDDSPTTELPLRD